MTHGSSPRVRGTVSAAISWLSIYRFIPACAGNCSREKSALTTSTVHPRVCGELQKWAYEESGRGGSSPRVRGTAEQAHLERENRRFIPACAGN